MLKSKTFLKKTRAGGVMKIVREHYLRDDIGCGASGCSACGAAHEGPVLEPNPLGPASSLCPWPHYLLPDTNVLLHQVRGTQTDELLLQATRGASHLGLGGVTERETEAQGRASCATCI